MGGAYAPLAKAKRPHGDPDGRLQGAGKTTATAKLGPCTSRTRVACPDGGRRRVPASAIDQLRPS